MACLDKILDTLQKSIIIKCLTLKKSSSYTSCVCEAVMINTTLQTGSCTIAGPTLAAVS